MPGSTALNPLETLLATLRRTAILPPDVTHEVLRRPEATGDDPVPLAKQLYQQGLLTKYQLSQLIAGRDDELVLGPYCLIDRIGEGGGGQVFKARHRVMNRVVALKRIRPDRARKDDTPPALLEDTGALTNEAVLAARPTAVQRFFQEAQLAAHLDHPNVVRSFDAGQVGDICYLVMEFVDGMDLTRLVREAGALPVADACEFIRQAALGLHHAHEKGLVHRDIKPSNLLVTPVVRPANGGPPRPGPAPLIKVLDLGLARYQAQDIEPGDTHATVGSPHFISPEQIKAADSADGVSDLYSLGCTFFFLLTGRPPFQADTVPGLLYAHLNRPPPRVEDVRPSVPTDVGDVAFRLMCKEPGARYASGAALAEALAEVIAKLNRPNADRSTPTPDDSVIIVDESVKLEVHEPEPEVDDEDDSTPRPVVARRRRRVRDPYGFQAMDSRLVAVCVGVVLFVSLLMLVLVVKKVYFSGQPAGEGRSAPKLVCNEPDQDRPA
jgi:serine/threonine-protein kinase